MVINRDMELHDLVELITREVLKIIGEKLAAETVHNLDYHAYGHPEVNLSQPTVSTLKLVTEKDVMARRKESKYLYISSKTIVTPLARDKAREIGLVIERKDT